MEGFNPFALTKISKIKFPKRKIYQSRILSARKSCNFYCNLIILNLKLSYYFVLNQIVYIVEVVVN